MEFIEHPTPISFAVDDRIITGEVEGSPEEWTFVSDDEYFLKMTVGKRVLRKSDIVKGRTPYNLNVLDAKITAEVRKILGK